MKKQRPKKGVRASDGSILKKSAEDFKPEKAKSVVEAPVEQQTHHLFVPILLVALAVVGIVGAIWVGGNLFFSNFKLSSTTLSTRLSDVALEQTITGQMQAFRLQIAYPDNSKKTFSAPSVGVQANIATTIATMRKEENQVKSRLEWWRPIPVTIATHADTATLHNFVATNITFAAKPSRNATISVAGGKVQLSDASMGMQYNLPNADDVITTAIANLQTAPIHLQEQVLIPAVTDAALAASKTKLDATLNQHITIAVGNQAVTPTPNDIASWLVLTPDTPNKTVDISVDGDKVQAYLNNLVTTDSQTPRSQIRNASAILIAGSNGVTITGAATAGGSILQNLLNGNGLQLNLPAQYIAFKTITAPTTGKWLEVNTTTKRMYAYDQGAVVRTFLVSAGARATPTVIGQFAIYAKYVSQNMAGENVDGSSYYQPHVPYVNYFYSDYAIHGNYWRPTSYFGNVNSSHGCVGTLVSDAAWIYDWAPIGTPVVVHI